MDYKCLSLILAFCVYGTAGKTFQDVIDFPTSPIGTTVGSRFVITCGLSNCDGQAVSWEHNGNPVYFSLTGVSDTTNYDIEVLNSNPEYHNLVIKSATRALAGKYTCGCAPTQSDVSLLVFDEPVLSPISSGQLVAGLEEVMQCQVEYGADGVTSGDEEAFELSILDWEGVPVTDVNAAEWDIDDATTPVTYKRFINSSMLTLDWEDDGQEYACVITMTDYSENNTISLSVLHTASNITLSPYDWEMNYFKTEQITATYSADPVPHRWVWSRMVDGQWQVIDDDDDQEATLTIGSNWAYETTLKVDILNTFDHDQDGITTEQNGTQMFDLYINECCRTGDAVHVTYSVLMTSLFVFLSTILLER